MCRDPHRPFLTARWADLCLLNYAVPPELLAGYLRPGTEPDLLRGEAYVSLVAFDFLETRLLDRAWPGYTDFPELNLRAYVRRGSRRGVTFVREFVPRQAIALAAQRLYNEPYLAAGLKRSRATTDGLTEIETRLDFGGRQHRISVSVGASEECPDEDSLAHLLKEHRWGYGTDRQGDLLQYKVLHPRWRTRPVREVNLEFDWSKVYGPDWTFLNRTSPRSAVFAVGSPVAVFWPTRPR